MLGNGVHRMKIRGWMIWLSIALFATRFSGKSEVISRPSKKKHLRK
jgi:hypothetical protein